MLYFLAILSGILPALLLVAFIYWKDKYQHEPISWILKSFWYGAMACVPAALIEAFWPECYLGELGTSIYYSFVVIALTEEAMKFLFFWLLVRHNPHFDERMDGIVYAACIGMGFAGLENIGYLMTDVSNLAMLGAARALISVPGHFFFAVFMGYYYSLSVYGPRRHRRLMLLCSLLVPTLLHGLFDCALLTFELGVLYMLLATVVFVVLFILMAVYVNRHMKRLLETDNRLMHKQFDEQEKA